MNELVQFLGYSQKVFQVKTRLRQGRDHRPLAVIPTLPVLLTLVLGALLRYSSYFDLAKKTKRRRWQHLIHWGEAISHDTLAYVCERFYLEDLRAVLVALNQTLKTNKNMESCKINGLLFLSLDANEHFSSRSRCCEQCSRREIEVKDDAGQVSKVTEYFHRYVFAQINGPKMNFLLDLEPIRPGEEEAGAALRLLGRLRRNYGARFFDAITVDAWYVKGRFLRAVTKLGWDWVVVLKQERMEIFQEARQLSKGQAPAEEFHDEARDRAVRLWRVQDLNFSQEYKGKVSVVHSLEKWTEKKIVGGVKTRQPQTSDWWWVASGNLDAYGPKLTYVAGHCRWGIENQAFNLLTQYYHLEHCYHHEPTAMLAQMLILLLAFTLFTAYAKLHSQNIRREQTTLKDLVETLILALEADLPWEQWFASG
jgi:hypothetical protein